jgi:phosphomannomutase
MNDAPLMLSVSGLRGIVGESLTADVAVRYGTALGQWFSQQCRGEPHIVIGRDSRQSGPNIQRGVVAGLHHAGCRVTAIGIATTPGTSVMIDHLGADGGIVITASHNPGQWNGVKALRADGSAPDADEAQQIIDAFRSLTDQNMPALVDRDPAVNADVVDVHTRLILRHIDAATIRRRGMKVVLDSVCGAGGPETAKLLDELGAQVVHLHADPTGDFPHVPEPTRDNLTSLCDAVREHGADLGLAQDPDADRLAIVAGDGTYIGEEYTLALCAMHVLRQGDVAAANLSTSRMLDDVAAQCGATVVRTKVGEANVTAAMRAGRATIGGEGNGGVIWPKICYVRNSLAGIALVLELLAQRDATLDQLIGELPRYAMVKEKLDADPAIIAALGDAMRKAFAGVARDEQDGVRLDWPDRWVHVRASNTEPIVRIIAEAPTQDDAAALVRQVRAAMG